MRTMHRTSSVGDVGSQRVGSMEDWDRSEQMLQAKLRTVTKEIVNHLLNHNDQELTTIVCSDNGPDLFAELCRTCDDMAAYYRDCIQVLETARYRLRRALAQGETLAQ